MAVKRSGAGSLNCLVTFQRRGDSVDDYGNPLPGIGPWQDEFTEPGRLSPQFGNRLSVESVTAARLSAMQPYNLTVRSSTRTRSVTPAWRVYDARAGVGVEGEPNRVFNIKTVVNPDERNAMLEMLVIEGESS